MDLSLRQLEQAVSIRRQIDALERRFTGLVGGGRATTSAGRKTGGGRRRRTMSAATRAKIAAAARSEGALLGLPYERQHQRGEDRHDNNDYQ